jgi:sterol 3beta-glucosyltransferase
MVFTILTTGSRGDIQPYLALGMALKKEGHKVRIAAFENYESFVRNFGLDYYPIKGDVSIIASSESVREMKADNPFNVFLSFNKLKSFVFDLQKDFFNACEGSDAILYHPGAAIGYFAAKYFKIPSILATPFPMTPTKEYPALIFYNSPRFGKQYNLLTHKIFEKIMWFASGSPVKQFWKQEFASPPEGFGNPYSKQNTRNLPTIISCSNFVFPRPKDWPEFIYYAGYWFLNEENDWNPPEGLEDFLHSGPPPIYVGFGSAGNSEFADQTTKIVIEALNLSGQRGVLATGWNGMSLIDHVPENIFILENAPHSWLFPKMAAVVHHGGAGTTAAGLRAGIPNVVIPHSNDQFAWGRRVFELGVGSKPLPRKKLSAEKLSDAINFVLREDIRKASENLGKKVRSENGAEAMAKIIINCVHQ